MYMTLTPPPVNTEDRVEMLEVRVGELEVAIFWLRLAAISCTGLSLVGFAALLRWLGAGP
jgi:hypothetical protein